MDLMATRWGTTDLAKIASPDFAQDEELMELYARMHRSALTPKAAGMLWRTIEDVDVRDALPLVQAPTLILHTTDSDFVPLSHGQYLAQHIPGARLIERPGPASRNFTAQPTDQRPNTSPNSLRAGALLLQSIGCSPRCSSPT